MVFGALAPIVANASTLLGVQITQLGASAEVAVSFSDALPTGWTIDGDGTQQLMITLRQTHGPHNNSFAGVNTIVGGRYLATCSLLLVPARSPVVAHLSCSNAVVNSPFVRMEVPPFSSVRKICILNCRSVAIVDGAGWPNML
jgi:hypothetical protein